MRQDYELTQCTFKPTINAGGSTGGLEDKAFYERLYEDSIRNRNKKLKTEIYASESEDRRYSFQPERVAKYKDAKFNLD